MHSQQKSTQSHSQPIANTIQTLTPTITTERQQSTIKKNNNNIQMSYYFPNNNSHENAEKESEFLNNISVKSL